MKMSKFVKWDITYKNALPDSAFAIVLPGGKQTEGITNPKDLRKLPFKDHEGKIDVPHLRNAVVRIAQRKTDFSPSQTAKAMQTLQMSANKFLKNNNESQSGIILSKYISKFEATTVDKISQIVDALKEKATNLKPTDEISFAVKDISLLIQDLEEVVDHEKAKLELTKNLSDKKPGETEAPAGTEESKYNEEGELIIEENGSEESDNMKNGDFVIEITGEIGWDVTADSIKSQLAKANGQDVIFEIASPGGSVFEGVEIFNAIRNYEGKTTSKLMGLAASMGSYIPLAADKVLAEDNAVYMIHNVWTMVAGDADDLQDEAELLENLNKLLAAEYVAKTGKSEKEILKLMDDETWLFGEEIKSEGFVDEMIVHDEKESKVAFDKEKILSSARDKVKSLLEKMRGMKFKSEKFKTLFTNKEVAKPSDTNSESKFDELIKVCEGFQSELKTSQERISKLQTELKTTKEVSKSLTEQLSKFEKTKYEKILNDTVQKISKFKGLNSEQTLGLKKHYLESKMSETALEEIGRETDEQIMSKLDEPKPTTKPTEMLGPAETESKEFSKMSKEEQLDTLANMQARDRGFVQ